MPDHEKLPSDRTIGDGVRSDGPNGQSSTQQNATSVEEKNGADDPVRRRPGDQGWLTTRPDDDTMGEGEATAGTAG